MGCIERRPRAGDRARPLFLEQIVERRLRPRQLRTVLRDISPRLRLEVIAKIRLILFAHLLRSGLLAMLRIRRVVLNAHLAHMQLRITRLADVEPSERQTERGERRAAAPTNERVRHGELAQYLRITARYAHTGIRRNGLPVTRPVNSNALQARCPSGCSKTTKFRLLSQVLICGSTTAIRQAVAATPGALLRHRAACFCVQFFSQMISFNEKCQKQQHRINHVSMTL